MDRITGPGFPTALLVWIFPRQGAVISVESRPSGARVRIRCIPQAGAGEFFRKVTEGLLEIEGEVYVPLPWSVPTFRAYLGGSFENGEGMRACSGRDDNMVGRTVTASFRAPDIAAVKPKERTSSQL
jgi:hypothetical protein